MTSPNGIETILFDLDGTLRHNFPSAEHTFFELAGQLGLPDSPVQRCKAMRWAHAYWAQSTEMLEDIERFGGMDMDFWTHYEYLHMLAFGIPENQAAELAGTVAVYMRETYRPENRLGDDVLPTLKALKKAGYTLGVVSNRTYSYDEDLEHLGLEGLFECVVAAGVVKSWKPDPEIFQIALQQLETRPEQSVYVGDNYYADVIGAERAGVRPILLDMYGVFPEANCTVIRSIGELLEKL